MTAEVRTAAFDKEEIKKAVLDILALEVRDKEMDFATIELAYEDCGIYGNGQIWIDYTITTGHRHRNIYGHVHGGAIATIADAGMGITACAASQYDVLPTVDLSILYHRAMTEGFYRVHVLTTHMGRRMVSCRAEIYDAEERLCVTAMAGYYVKE